MKITVLSGADKNFSELQDITSKTLLDYCVYQNYELIIKEFHSTERPTSWYKIPEIIQCLKNGSDFVLWIDADAIIVNKNIRIESFIENGKDFYFANNYIGINCGVMLFRNSPLILNFLADIWNQTDYIYHMWWENGAIMDYLKNKSFPPEKLKMLDESVFNSPFYWKGCFIHHLWGTPLTERIRVFRSLVEG
jgi:hypothetical protein